MLDFHLHVTQFAVCLQIMVAITEKQRRPEVPKEVDVPGGTFAGLAGYIQLMEDCWQDDAEQRPTFELVIVTLRGLLEQAMTNRWAATTVLLFQSYVQDLSSHSLKLACLALR